MENYLHVLFESFWVATVIPLSAEPTYFAMLGFGGYNMWPAFACAVIGSTAGQTFNWLAGHTLYGLKEKKEFNVSEYWYNKLSGIFNRYLIFLLLFAWAPLCNILVVIAGFFNLRLRIALPLIVLGELFNYGARLL